MSESDIGSEGGGAERSREDKYATPCYDDGASMKVAMNLLQRQPSVCRPRHAPNGNRLAPGALRRRTATAVEKKVLRNSLNRAYNVI